MYKTMISMVLMLVYFMSLNVFAADVNIENIDLEKVSDGIYTAEYTYEAAGEYGIVTAGVEVEVKDNKIITIKILKHITMMGKPAEKIIDEVIKTQSLMVDAISGATISSKTILKAIELALAKGIRE